MVANSMINLVDKTMQHHSLFKNLAPFTPLCARL